LAEFFSIHGLTINTISPGFINNKMYKKILFYPKKKFRNIKIPNFIRRRGNNIDVINLIEFLLEQKNNYINGKIYEIDGGS
jgi:NAD(P)-dependent dehydrogenase (short-subunit alcohol dehydrogenase family)